MFCVLSTIKRYSVSTLNKDLATDPVPQREVVGVAHETSVQLSCDFHI